MKKKYNGDILNGRKYVRLLLFAAIAIVAVGYFFAEPSSPIQGLCILGGIACILATVYVNFKYCRCPYCGQIIYTTFGSSDVCPRCNRNVITGKKVIRK